MCKSVKGAAFFGSSIHVVASFAFLLWFLFDTVITEVHINLWRCVSPEDDPPKNYNVLVHYLNLPFKFLYYTCLCVTGIYIFRGVERNAPRVIKFALLVFVIVQVIALALFITISLNYWEDDESNTNTVHVQAARAGRATAKESIPNSIQESSLIIPSRLIDMNNLALEYGSGGDGGSDEDGNYTIHIEVISHRPENILAEASTSSSSEEEMKAVLESPIAATIIPTTTPIPNEPDPPQPPMSPTEVVLVKVVKEAGGLTSPRKLSHNQLVQLVFQVFLVGFNAVGSFIYTGILVIHLTSL